MLPFFRTSDHLHAQYECAPVRGIQIIRRLKAGFEYPLLERT